MVGFALNTYKGGLTFSKQCKHIRIITEMIYCQFGKDCISLIFAIFSVYPRTQN